MPKNNDALDDAVKLADKCKLQKHHQERNGKVQKFPDIWNDNPDEIAAFNREIGIYDDGIDWGREYVEYIE